jgi:hypothetical protein
MRHARLDAEYLEEHAHALRGVTVVVGHQDATWRVTRPLSILRPLRRRPDLLSCRVQSDCELTPLSQAAAVRMHLAAVHFRERLDPRQPDSQSSLKTVGAAIDSRKQLKDLRQHLRLDANTRVTHGDG